MLVEFNRNPITIGGEIPQPSQDTIEGSLNLRQVSLEDAARYGGPITKAALGLLRLKGTRKYVTVDTKVNLLLPGFIPAIPGWHTDGVPRGDALNPGGKGEPRISAQAAGAIPSSYYHLLVTGHHSQTQFIEQPLSLNVEDSSSLYEKMTRDVENIFARSIDVPRVLTAPSCAMVEWDWWSIHRAVPANARGWRYLIRVTESDFIEPRTDPADFIRTQTQVYVPTAFGW